MSEIQLEKFQFELSTVVQQYDCCFPVANCEVLLLHLKYFSGDCCKTESPAITNTVDTDDRVIQNSQQTPVQIVGNVCKRNIGFGFSAKWKKWCKL